MSTPSMSRRAFLEGSLLSLGCTALTACGGGSDATDATATTAAPGPNASADALAQAQAGSKPATFPRRLAASDFSAAGLRGCGFFMAKYALPPLENFDALQRLGAKLARVWLSASWNGSDYVVPDADYATLDAGLDRLAQRSIYTVIALSIEREDMPWGDPARLAAYARWCGSVAQRYRGQWRVAAIDAMNEPVPVQAAVNGAFSSQQFVDVEAAWRTLAVQCINAIRAQDATRVVVYQVGLGSDPGNFSSSTPPLPVGNVVYSPHVYHPHSLTHQNVAEWLAGQPFGAAVAYGPEQAAVLSASIARIAAWNPRLPKLVGEFSCVNWAPGDSAARYVADCVRQFEQAGMSWLYHEWRAFPGWDAEALPDGQGASTRSDSAPIVSVLRRALATAPQVAAASTGKIG